MSSLSPPPSREGGRDVVSIRVKRGSSSAGGTPSRELSSAGSLKRATTLAFADPRPASNNMRVRVDVSRGSARAQTASSRGLASRDGLMTAPGSPGGGGGFTAADTSDFRETEPSAASRTIAGSLGQCTVPSAILSVFVLGLVVFLLGVDAIGQGGAVQQHPASVVPCVAAPENASNCGLLAEKHLASRTVIVADAVVAFIDSVDEVLHQALPSVSSASCQVVADAVAGAIDASLAANVHALSGSRQRVALNYGQTTACRAESAPAPAAHAVRFAASLPTTTIDVVVGLDFVGDGGAIITGTTAVAASSLRRLAVDASRTAADRRLLRAQHLDVPAIARAESFAFYPERVLRDPSLDTSSTESVVDLVLAVFLCLALLIFLLLWLCLLTSPSRAASTAALVFDQLLVDTEEFHRTLGGGGGGGESRGGATAASGELASSSRPGTAGILGLPPAAMSQDMEGRDLDGVGAEDPASPPHEMLARSRSKHQFVTEGGAPPAVRSTEEDRAVAVSRTVDGRAAVESVQRSVARLRKFLAYVPSAALFAEPPQSAAAASIFSPQTGDFFFDQPGSFEEVRGASRCSSAASTPRNIPLVVMGADQLENFRSATVSPSALPSLSVNAFGSAGPSASILGRVPSPQEGDDDSRSLSRSNNLPTQRPDSAMFPGPSSYVFPVSVSGRSAGNTSGDVGALSPLTNASKQPTSAFLEDPGSPASPGVAVRKRSSAATSHTSGGDGTLSPFGGGASTYLNPLSGPEGASRRMSAMRGSRRMSALSAIASDEFHPDEVLAEAMAGGGGGGIPSVIRMKRCTVVHCRLSIPSLEHSRLPHGFMMRIVHETSQTFLEAAIKTAAAFDGVTASIGITHAVFSWNAFRPYQFHESRAALCALHMEQALREALDNDKCRIASPSFYLCAVTGHALAGTVAAGGTSYPVIAGENTVLARGGTLLGSVLCATTLLAETTYSIAKAHVTAIPRDTIGTELQRLVLFEMRGEAAPGSPRGQDAARRDAMYSNAFSLMRQSKYDEANAELEKLLDSASTGGPIDPAYRWAWLQTQYALENPSQIQLLKQMAQNPNAPGPAMADEGGQRPGLFRRIPQWLLHEDRFDDLDAVDEMEAQTPTEAMSDGFSSIDAPSTEPRHRRFSQTDFSADPALRTALVHRSVSRSRVRDSPSDGTLPTTVVTDPDEENPNVVFDDRGERWSRSERILGRGTFGVVRVGLSSEGSLGAMKYIPLNAMVQGGGAGSGGGNTGGGSVAGSAARDGSPGGNSGSNTASGNSAQVESALAEVGILSKLRHTSIVRYVSCSVQKDDFVVILEYCGGGSLGRLIALFGALPMPVVQRYARDILTGLNYLHKHGVTHRDLSLNNVLLSIDGECKLSDFGGSVTRSSSAPMTMTNVLGTPAFMAPETCTGQISMMSDIWSFGIMLCIMASGRLPYDEELLNKPVDFLRRLATDDKFGPLIPPEVTEKRELHQLVLSCLKREVMERPWAESLLMHAFFMV